MPTVKLKDVELYYEAHGRGRPFVFLNATASDCEVWKIYQVPEFSRDHRVVLFDYRGTGRSGKPSIKYSTQMFAADLAALMDHLQADQAIVLGHSMGGRVAQLLALDHPDKVQKLILASTGASFPETKGLPFKVCQGMIERGYENYLRHHWLEVGFTKEFADKNPNLVERYLQARFAHLCPVEFNLRHLIARQEHDTSDRLKEISVPTLILIGSEERDASSDLSHQASTEALALGIPHARRVTLPDAKHAYFASHPEFVHRVIREFLEQD
ncbi:MAG: alpha/beta fold hydrolase [Candidatus Binatia bacterium]